MKSKKFPIAMAFLSAAAIASIAAFNTTGLVSTWAENIEGTEIWNHYSGTAHLDARGNKEYWVNCSTHEHLFTAPDVDAQQIVDQGAPGQAEIDSWASNDDRVINKRRRVLTFESDASEANYVVKGNRNGITDKEIVTGEGAGEGAATDMKALKLSTNVSDTLSFAFSEDYLNEAFADPAVTGIRFDAKSNINIIDFYYREGDNSHRIRYENSNDAGFGLLTRWKSFVLPRSFYNNRAAASNKGEYYACWANVSVSDGSNWIMIDNVRPVTDNLDPVYKLDGGRLVDPSLGGSYTYTASIRRGTDKGEALVVRNEDTSGTYPYEFDYNIKTEGVSSLKIHKTNQAVHYSCPKLPTTMADDDELVFDFYSTGNYNPSFATRKGAWNGPGFDGDTPGANTWVTFSVKKSEFTGNGNEFLCVTNSMPENVDLYIDNLRIRRAGTNLLGFESDELCLTDVTSTSRMIGRYGGSYVNDPIIRMFQTNRSTTHIGVTDALASEGTHSFHICRPGNNEVALWLGKAYYTRIQNGETMAFDLYSTNNGTSAVAVGDGYRAAYTGSILPVRQWNTIELNASNLTSDGRFIVIQNDAKGDFYLDNFRWL